MFSVTKICHCQTLSNTRITQVDTFYLPKPLLRRIKGHYKVHVLTRQYTQTTIGITVVVLLLGHRWCNRVQIVQHAIKLIDQWFVDIC